MEPNSACLVDWLLFIVSRIEKQLQVYVKDGGEEMKRKLSFNSLQ